ncbi:MAG TPA: hypothetical protein VN645_14675, partial [Steroidobacteraceae bacterium]|nr:hypothetical protein [Steroidobacteraceae bacterium]
MKARIPLLLAVPLLPALLSGCLRARVDESRELATAITSTESVVVLAKPQVEGAGAESEFLDCVGQRISGHGHGIAVHPNESFTDKLFPWFEPGTVPTRPEQIGAVLAQPGVSEQVAATGVRYVVWLDGGTRKTDGGGSLACGVAPGAAGCIGFGWWEKESSYEATVWDLRQSKSVGSVGATVSGTSAVVGAIVPLPFIARVEGT